MSKIVLALIICMLAYTRAGIRDNIAASIPGEFDMDISVVIDGTTTDQKISVSDKYNAAKNVQTITYTKEGKQIKKIFTTVSLFAAQKTFMKSDDSTTCHERAIEHKIELIQLLRRVILDPDMSQIKTIDEENLIQFTINWKFIESIDDWTHIYFDKNSYVLKRIEQMTESHEKPWITFHIVSPIIKAEHPREHFTIKGCYESSTDDEVKLIAK